MDWSNLPEEIWLHIMSFLALRDRKNLRLINKHFYHLTYDATVIKNDVLVVGTTSELDNLAIRKKAYSLKIKTTNLETFSSFWSECGTFVKSLELYLVDVTNPTLLQILGSVPNLEFLVLSTFDENEKGKVRTGNPEALPLSFKDIQLPKLISMDFYYIPTNQEGRYLYEMLENSPKLKRFSFEWMVNLPGNVSFVLKCLQGRGAAIKELDFSYSKMNDSMFAEIISDVGKQLTGLYLRVCSNLTGVSLKLIAQRFPELKEIDIARTFFPHDEITSFLKNFKNLTHVSLKQTKLQTLSDCLDNSRNKLKALELSNCRGWLTEDSIIMTLSPFPNLVDLRIDYLHIDDNSFLAIIPFITNIKFIILNGNRNITEKSLSVMSENCRKLRSLSLQDTRVHDIAWVNNLKGLVHLDLYGCSRVKKDSLLKMNLLELQTLDVSGTGVDTVCFEEIISKCPSLLHIYVDFAFKRAKKYKFPKFHYGMSRFAPESIFDS